MIRIILKRRQVHFSACEDNQWFETFDVELPELESRLKRGGSGPDGYDRTDFVGIEVLPEQKGDLLPPTKEE